MSMPGSQSITIRVGKRLFILFFFTTALCCKNSPESPFYMPAEWEKHKAVWIGWEAFEPYYQPVTDVVKALMPTVTVKMVADNDSELGNAKSYLQNHGVDTSMILFYTIKDNRVWMRDHGGSFLVNKKGEKKIADFNWDGYGIAGWVSDIFDGNPDSINNKMSNPFYQNLVNAGGVDSMMAVSEKILTVASKVTIEGGAIEVNGRGTLILCEAVIFQRNPGASKEFIEEDLKNTLGVKKIIWLKKGLAEDPHLLRRITGNYFGGGTGGHTDEFVRFASPNTILLGWVDESKKDKHPINKINYERMSENLKLLEEATDQDGKSFTIIKVPLPDPVEKKVLIINAYKSDWDDGFEQGWFNKSENLKVGDTVIAVAASSYLNYLVTNEAVLLPTYTRYGSSIKTEDEIKRIFTGLFPKRKLHFIDVIQLNYSGGGIHCITQQQPE